VPAARVALSAAARAKEQGVEARVSVLRGFPSRKSASRPRGSTLVSWSAGMGWGAVKRALFGSVSTGVLHHAKCPVLIVRAEAMDVAAAAEGADERALSDAPLVAARPGRAARRPFGRRCPGYD
jgi:hypothetical protein